MPSAEAVNGKQRTVNGQGKKEAKYRAILFCCHDFITGYFHSLIKVLIVHHGTVRYLPLYSRFLENNCGVDAAKTRVGSQDIVAFKINRL